MSLVLLSPPPRQKNECFKYEVEGKSTLMPPPTGAVIQSIPNQVASGASLLCLCPMSFDFNRTSVFCFEGLQLHFHLNALLKTKSTSQCKENLQKADRWCVSLSGDVSPLVYGYETHVVI